MIWCTHKAFLPHSYWTQLEIHSVIHFITRVFLTSSWAGFRQRIYLFIYLFIYNNFICNNQYKKAAIREELNPHVRWPPKNIYKAIKEI